MDVRGTSLAYAAVFRPLSVLLCALLLGLAACGGDDDSGSSSSSKTDTSTASAETAQTEGVCKEVDQPTPRDGGGQKKPSKPLDNSKKYDGTLQTSCGAVTMRLHPLFSPDTLAGF